LAVAEQFGAALRPQRDLRAPTDTAAIFRFHNVGRIMSGVNHDDVFGAHLPVDPRVEMRLSVGPAPVHPDGGIVTPLHAGGTIADVDAGAVWRTIRRRGRMKDHAAQ